MNNLDEFLNLNKHEQEEILKIVKISYTVKRLIISLSVIVIIFILGSPYYNVWKQGLVGEAELARAEQNRKILVNEAKAKKDAAKFWAEAEVARAKGAAKANEIVASSLGGSEGYLRWLYIEKLDQIDGQIIYLPTETGMPILEAGKSVKQQSSNSQTK